MKLDLKEISNHTNNVFVMEF